MKTKALVVDDEPIMALTLATFLEMEGFQVETANSAAEAIAKLAPQIFDLVVTDIKMETELAGYDVVRAAQLQPNHPVTVIITAFLDMSPNGADALLHKPFHLQSLLDVFARAREQRASTHST